MNMECFDWYEELPAGCPPITSKEANGLFYRLIDGQGITLEDFDSHEKAGKSYRKNSTCPCKARAVSIFENLGGCVNLKKLSVHKDKLIAEVNLTQADGKVSKTGSPYHYSWWRTVSFEYSAAIIAEVVGVE